MTFLEGGGINISGKSTDDSVTFAVKKEPRDFSLPGGVLTSTKGDFHNGTFAETFNALVTSDGATITLTVTNSSGGDLTSQFSSGNSTFTGGSTIALTAGTDSAPQTNFIYVLESVW